MGLGHRWVGRLGGGGETRLSPRKTLHQGTLELVYLPFVISFRAFALRLLVYSSMPISLMVPSTGLSALTSGCRSTAQLIYFS